MNIYASGCVKCLTTGIVHHKILIVSTNLVLIYIIYDIRDEDYDRGKMKKMKKAKRSFDGPNPFQEAANLKAQKKSNPNVNRRPSSANTPFRI